MYQQFRQMKVYEQQQGPLSPPLPQEVKDDADNARIVKQVEYYFTNSNFREWSSFTLLFFPTPHPLSSVFGFYLL